jgi:hypothetical protein
MFFTKRDRKRLYNMPTRADLDQALSQNKQDVEEAIQRWQDQMKKAMDDNAKALSDLQTAHENDDNFSQELATLQETHNRIQSLAQMPVAAIITPPSSPGASTGAAGTTVGGKEAHDAAVAAGGEPIKGQGDHPGSIPTPPAEPDKPANPAEEPAAEQPTPAEEPPKES